MLIVVSPAKSLDYESPLATKKSSEPRMLDHAEKLVAIMAAKSPGEIQKLMSVSPTLAELNFERFQDWQRPFTTENSRPAVLAFNGDVYTGLDAAATFTERDFTHSQKTLRILSGLYGVLRPLDLMMPYRLEMGTKLANRKGANLYDFWRTDVTEMLNDDMSASPGSKVLVNLASNEYFGAVDQKALNAKIVSPAFLDSKDGGPHKNISFFAKRARGAMSQYLIKERITSAAGITGFTGMGYAYDEADSTPERPVFKRTN
ncbi:MAG: peroxide stress protein YaaA [Actinomycetota bacterium]